MELKEAIKNKTGQEITDAINSMNAEDITMLQYDWQGIWAREKQILPTGDWFVWL